MAVIFETERLIARHWDPERDAEAAFQIYGDPEVMRYLGREAVNPPVPSMAAMRERLERVIESNAKQPAGAGGWALEEKGGELIGAVLVKLLPDASNQPTQDLEVGWHLRRSAWGKGYATEAGRGGIRYAFETLRVPMIHAVVYKENLRSIGVARRLGMVHLGSTDRYYGVMLELFALRSPDA